MRQCRERAVREGWAVVESYSGRAIFGASLIRSGIQVLLADARASRFDMILSEALDRISRDQKDVAGMFKRLRFPGAPSSPYAQETNRLNCERRNTADAAYRRSQISPNFSLLAQQ